MVPESNQTSTVSVILRYFAGSTPKSSQVAANHASMPPLATRRGGLLEQRARFPGCSSSVSRSRKKGSGTPQLRWRESVQSGRLAIIASMRERPHDG